jgi:carotenoid cleavage dioxygenase
MKVLNSFAKLNTGRRSFMWNMGTAMSAALAAAVPGMSTSRNNPGSGLDAEVDRLSKQLGVLEDEKNILKLHRSYEACLDRGMYEEAVDLFTEDGAVVFNGGVFEGKKSGISRLYRDCFRPGSTGKKIGPVPGFQGDAEQQSEAIRVGADRLSAKAQFPYTVQVGTPMAPDSQLVQMARLHGEGIMKWCESGICEVSYAKDTTNGSWMMQRLEYRVLLKTDYRPGRSHARPISVPLFSQTYPKNPAGPDRLIPQKQPPQQA